jgi:hypothetical protein
VASLPAAIAISAGCGRQCDPGPTPATYTVSATLTTDEDGGQRTFLPDGGAIAWDDCIALCTGNSPSGPNILSCEPQIDKQGQAIVVCQPRGGDCTGRRPENFRERPNAEGFARMALLEDASVHAFRRLASELISHGAPGSLVARARRAALDEVRHARMMTALARRCGQTPERADVAPLEVVRDLESIAVENAIEGCVRETFGALVASWHGQSERDPVVRRTMAAIAVDEIRHAELGWAVDEWIRPHLSAAALRRVARARRDAVQTLLDDTRHDPRLHAWAHAASRELWGMAA